MSYKSPYPLAVDKGFFIHANRSWIASGYQDLKSYAQQKPQKFR